MMYKNFVGVKKNFPYFFNARYVQLAEFLRFILLAAHTNVKEHRYFLGECNILSIFTKFFVVL